MRRTVIIILAALIFLFPPYYEEGFFTSDWGWMVITDAFPPFALDIWWLVWIIEFVALGVVNMVWKKNTDPIIVGSSQAGQPAPGRAVPSADVSEEIVKLNDLRKAGVLSDEEFADQKARLLGAAPAGVASADRAEAAGSASAAAPTSDARLVASDRLASEAGVKVNPMQKFVLEKFRQFGVPVPAQPWMDADQSALFKYAATTGVVFAILYAIMWRILTGQFVGIGTGVALALAWGAVTFFGLPVLARRLRKKHNLPEWNELPL